MEKKTINTLMKELMLGTISQQDADILAEWIAGSDSHQREFELFMKRKDLSEWVEKADLIDAQEAWKRFSDDHDMSSYTKTNFFNLRHSWMKYVAVLVGFVVVSSIFLWRNHESIKENNVRAELSQEVKGVIQKAESTGKVGAVVESAFKNGEANTDVDEYSKNHPQAQQYAILSQEAHSCFSKEELLSAYRVTTYHDKEFWVTLDDGTLVHLNYNTRLIHPVKFMGNIRNVVLDGEAYFMVAKGEKPFVVHTLSGDVKVYGTEFNVKTQPGITEVVLVKGSVGITPTSGKELKMLPNQQCRITDNVCELNEVDVEPFIAWNTGTFSFRYQTLGKVMEVLSKWYNVEVEYASSDLKNMEILGDFDRYVQLKNILDALGKSTGMSFTYKSDGSVIVSKP